MSVDLQHSYRLCQRMARGADSNFYYSFLLLPRPKRSAMCALYAFLRRVDDLGDGDLPIEQRRAALEQLRGRLHRALAGDFDDPLMPALADTVERYAIPPQYLLDAIDGVEMDLDGRSYETFADLEQYCYKVASVVGLSCIHIWGFDSSEAIAPAEQCGLAFQLTNILRDLKEDAERGRTYLPLEDLRSCGYTPEDLRASVQDERFRRLMELEIARAEGFYAEAEPLADYLHHDGRRVFCVMMRTYRGLLEEIKRREGDVFTSRVRLSPWRKLTIAACGLLAPPRGTAPRPNVKSRAVGAR